MIKEKSAEYANESVVDLTEMTKLLESISNIIKQSLTIVGSVNSAKTCSDMASVLGSYNTMRGGEKGYSGFVFEELHAANEVMSGTDIQVLRNNGAADYIVKKEDGAVCLAQAKAGYQQNQVDWSRYKGQEIIVDKGNDVLMREAEGQGLIVHQSSVSKKQADMIAKAQQFESKLTGRTTAPITATVASAHEAGIAGAKLTAKVGVGMKLGENLYELVTGSKDLDDALVDVAVDGIQMVGSAYAGTAILTAASTAATAALAETTIGVAATSAMTAVTSTAIGTAVATGTTALTTAAAAAATTIAAAPLLPILAVGAGIGFLFKLFD